MERDLPRIDADERGVRGLLRRFPRRTRRVLLFRRLLLHAPARGRRDGDRPEADFLLRVGAWRRDGLDDGHAHGRTRLPDLCDQYLDEGELPRRPLRAAADVARHVGRHRLHEYRGRLCGCDRHRRRKGVFRRRTLWHVVERRLPDRRNQAGCADVPSDDHRLRSEAAWRHGVRPHGDEGRRLAWRDRRPGRQRLFRRGRKLRVDQGPKPRHEGPRVSHVDRRIRGRDGARPSLDAPPAARRRHPRAGIHERCRVGRLGGRAGAERNHGADLQPRPFAARGRNGIRRDPGDRGSRRQPDARQAAGRGGCRLLGRRRLSDRTLGRTDRAHAGFRDRRRDAGGGRRNAEDERHAARGRGRRVHASPARGAGGRHERHGATLQGVFERAGGG